MNREEQKASKAKKYYPEDINCYYAFLHGAEWADKHPKIVWHEASEMPQGYPIICRNERGFLWIQYYHIDWESYIEENDDMVEWAYINDLLPKGGEE